MGAAHGTDDEALTAVSEALLGIAGDLSMEAVLGQLVHAARRLAGARYAALGTPDGDGGFARWLTSGLTDDEIEAIGPLPRTHGVLGAMLAEPGSHRTDDVRRDARFGGWWPDAHPEMQPFVAVPIVFRGEVAGAFYLANPEGGRQFDADDEARVHALAAHAAVLIEHARLYERTRELTVLDERNRLARELHDAMTQTMFSLRLTLETASALLDDDPAATRPVLADARALVDRAFEELRSLVFQLRPPALDDEGLAVSIAKYVDVAARSAGLRAAFDTDADLLLPAANESQLFRIVQEAVTNVLRHAGARTIAVSLRRRDGTVVATVTDDGKGFDTEARSVTALHLGLTSMRERAESVGGHVDITSTPGAGTSVRVEVPGD